MAGEVFAFEELEVVVGQTNQVEDSSAIAPMKPCRMNISVHEAVIVHMRHCTSNLSEDEQKSRGRKVGLAELLPQADMLGAVSLEK